MPPPFVIHWPDSPSKKSNRCGMSAVIAPASASSALRTLSSGPNVGGASAGAPRAMPGPAPATGGSGSGAGSPARSPSPATVSAARAAPPGRAGAGDGFSPVLITGAASAAPESGTEDAVATASQARSLPPVLRSMSVRVVESPASIVTLSDPGSTSTFGATTPSPNSSAVAVGALWASLVTVRDPANTPAAVGANVTGSERLAPAATVNPDVGTWKWLGEAATAVTCSTSLPVFVTAIESVRVAPTNSVPSESESGTRSTFGTPVTCSAAPMCTSGSSGSLLVTWTAAT